jgi:hypothetical protein
MKLETLPPAEFHEWLDRTKSKPKFYIWTDQQKQTVKDACLFYHELWLYMKVELQEIKYEKAVEILECKHRL